MSISLKDQKRFWSKVNVVDNGCWEWKDALHKSGYPYFALGRAKIRASRLSYELAYGMKPSAGLFVCHECNNKGCVNPAHLRVDTPKSNSRDCMLAGDCPSQVLTMDQAREIRREYNDNIVSVKELSARYGVNRAAIVKIIEGIRFVDPDYVRTRFNRAHRYAGLTKYGERWIATATHSGKKHHIGVYDTEDDAALAYNEYVLRHNLSKPLNQISGRAA